MSAMNNKDYYKILGVSSDATTEEIRKAFQQKARQFHPDINKDPSAEEKFKEASEAYAILSDEEKRKRYDRMRTNPFAAAYGDYGTYGASGRYSRSSGEGGVGGFGGFGDFGGFPFGGFWTTGSSRDGYRSRSTKHSRAYRPTVGADINVSLELSAEEAKQGSEKTVTYQCFDSCDVCHGQGSVHYHEPTVCPTCGGRGSIEADLSSIFGTGSFEVSCPECEGAGKVVQDPCVACHGTGRILAAKTQVVHVPQGSHDGDLVRIPKAGNAGTNGEAAGDLLCNVIVHEERLDPIQLSGFRSMGLALPALVFSYIYEFFGLLSMLATFIFVLGLIKVVRGGIKLRSRWFKHAGQAFVSGLGMGLWYAMVLWAFHSCSTLGTRGYVGI